MSEAHSTQASLLQNNTLERELISLQKDRHRYEERNRELLKDSLDRLNSFNEQVGGAGLKRTRERLTEAKKQFGSMVVSQYPQWAAAAENPVEFQRSIYARALELAKSRQAEEEIALRQQTQAHLDLSRTRQDYLEWLKANHSLRVERERLTAQALAEHQHYSSSLVSLQHEMYRQADAENRLRLTGTVSPIRMDDSRPFTASVFADRPTPADSRPGTSQTPVPQSYTPLPSFPTPPPSSQPLPPVQPIQPLPSVPVTQPNMQAYQPNIPVPQPYIPVAQPYVPVSQPYAPVYQPPSTYIPQPVQPAAPYTQPMEPPKAQVIEPLPAQVAQPLPVDPTPHYKAPPKVLITKPNPEVQTVPESQPSTPKPTPAVQPKTVPPIVLPKAQTPEVPKGQVFFPPDALTPGEAESSGELAVETIAAFGNRTKQPRVLEPESRTKLEGKATIKRASGPPVVEKAVREVSLEESEEEMQVDIFSAERGQEALSSVPIISAKPRAVDPREELKTPDPRTLKPKVLTVESDHEDAVEIVTKKDPKKVPSPMFSPDSTMGAGIRMPSPISSTSSLPLDRPQLSKPVTTIVGTLKPADRLRVLAELIKKTEDYFTRSKAKFNPEIRPAEGRLDEVIGGVYGGRLPIVRAVEDYVNAVAVMGYDLPYPFFPPEILKRKKGFNEPELLDVMGEEAQNIYLRLRDFYQEAVREGWMSKEQAVQSLSSTMLNYRTSKSQLQRAQNFVLAALDNRGRTAMSDLNSSFGDDKSVGRREQRSISPHRVDVRAPSPQDGRTYKSVKQALSVNASKSSIDNFNELQDTE